MSDDKIEAIRAEWVKAKAMDPACVPFGAPGHVALLFAALDEALADVTRSDYATRRAVDRAEKAESDVERLKSQMDDLCDAVTTAEDCEIKWKDRAKKSEAAAAKLWAAAKALENIKLALRMPGHGGYVEWAADDAEARARRYWGDLCEVVRLLGKVALDAAVDTPGWVREEVARREKTEANAAKWRTVVEAASKWRRREREGRTTATALGDVAAAVDALDAAGEVE